MTESDATLDGFNYLRDLLEALISKNKDRIDYGKFKTQWEWYQHHNWAIIKWDWFNGPYDVKGDERYIWEKPPIASPVTTLDDFGKA